MHTVSCTAVELRLMHSTSCYTHLAIFECCWTPSNGSYMRPGGNTAPTSPVRPDTLQSGYKLPATAIQSFRSSHRAWRPWDRLATVIHPPMRVHRADTRLLPSCTIHDSASYSPHPYTSDWFCIHTGYSHLMTVCILMCVCATGASDGRCASVRGTMINIWGNPDPISISLFNCNYSQTRSRVATRCVDSYMHHSHSRRHVPSQPLVIHMLMV